MVTLTKLLFWSSLLMVAYVYIGYPLIVTLMGIVGNRREKASAVEPRVSIVISAFNEAEHIGNTIENKLLLDYPPEKLDIIVVSDGSTDRTDDIVRQYADRRVRLIRQEPRAGKTAALNRAISQATGEIIVFSDANSMYARDALAKLVQNFAHPSVGYVTGKMIYADPDGTVIGDGCSSYMKYENFLREQESKVASVIGVDGGIDAVRRELFRPMKPEQLPDFVLPLTVAEQGYRIVYEPGAILKESTLKDSGDEYRMRVRVSLRAFWALWDMRKLLDLRKWGLLSWQLWSHKVLRYLCFAFLLGAYVSNSLLWNQGTMYKVAFIGQNLCYLAALCSPVLEAKGHGCMAFRFAYYFVLLNVAAAHAFFKFLIGRKQVLWSPRKG